MQTAVGIWWASGLNTEFKHVRAQLVEINIKLEQQANTSNSFITLLHDVNLQVTSNREHNVDQDRRMQMLEERIMSLERHKR